MKNGGGGLVDAVGLAEVVILVDHGIERAALDERANLGHFRGGENGGYRAVDITSLLPLLLVLEERLFHRLHFAELRCGSSVARGYARVRVHGQGEIAVNQVNLAAADVI